MRSTWVRFPPPALSSGNRGISNSSLSYHRSMTVHSGGISRALLEELIALGLSQRGIAARIGCSQGTVKHWLREYELRTQPRGRGSSYRADGTSGDRREEPCPKHGQAVYVYTPSARRFVCRQCNTDAVDRRRQSNKDVLLDIFGSKCETCSYSASRRALEFHHIDPQQKEFGISGSNWTLARERLESEARKCALLCSNCHAEVEDGIRTLPVEIILRAAPHLLIPAQLAQSALADSTAPVL